MLVHIVSSYIVRSHRLYLRNSLWMFTENNEATGISLIDDWNHVFPVKHSPQLYFQPLIVAIWLAVSIDQNGQMKSSSLRNTLELKLRFFETTTPAINHHQPPSTIINHHQPPSTTINPHQPPSTPPSRPWPQPSCWEQKSQGPEWCLDAASDAIDKAELRFVIHRKPLQWHLFWCFFKTWYIYIYIWYIYYIYRYIWSTYVIM